MKNLILALLLISGLSAKANDTAYIKTDVQCDMCKSRIESKLGKIKGISYANVSVDDDVITVVYDPKEAPLDKIETLITKIGYDANDKEASGAAIKRLPGCCRPPSE